MTDETRLAEHLGRLDGELRAVQVDVTELKGDMKTLLAAVNQARGGWKTILIVAGVSGAAGRCFRRWARWWLGCRESGEEPCNIHFCRGRPRGGPSACGMREPASRRFQPRLVLGPDGVD